MSEVTFQVCTWEEGPVHSCLAQSHLGVHGKTSIDAHIVSLCPNPCLHFLVFVPDWVLVWPDGALTQTMETEFDEVNANTSH